MLTELETVSAWFVCKSESPAPGGLRLASKRALVLNDAGAAPNHEAATGKPKEPQTVLVGVTVKP